MHQNDPTLNDLSTFKNIEFVHSPELPRQVWPENELKLTLPDSGSELVRNETQPVVGIEIPTIDTIAVVRHGKNLGMFSLESLSFQRISKRGAIPRFTPISDGQALNVYNIRQLLYNYTIDSREADPILELSLKRKNLVIKWLGLGVAEHAKEPLTVRPLTVRYTYTPVIV